MTKGDKTYKTLLPQSSIALYSTHKGNHAAMAALRDDFEEIRVWLRRRQLLMAGAQNLLGRLLIERTLPLLESVPTLVESVVLW